MTLLQRMASTRTVCFRLAVSALLLWLAAPLAAQEKHLEILRGKLQAELERIVDEYEGVAGVHLVDLTSGDRFGVNDELLFPQASTIKVPMLLELFRRAESEPGLLRRRGRRHRGGADRRERRVAASHRRRVFSLPGGPRDLHDRLLGQHVHQRAHRRAGDGRGQRALGFARGPAHAAGAQDATAGGVRARRREPVDAPRRGADHGADRELRSADEQDRLCARARDPRDLQGRTHTEPGAETGADRVQARWHHRGGDRMGVGGCARPPLRDLGDVQLRRQRRRGGWRRSRP